MRNISDNYKNLSLASEVTTLAQLWRITRRDGEIFGFTDHDQDIIFGDLTYQAAKGYLPSAVSNAGNLAVDNLDVATMLEAGLFTEADIEAGVWDNAVIDLYQIDYEHLDRGVMILAAGWKVGNFTVKDHEFSAEIRSKTQVLQQVIVELTSPECRASLGDLRCKIALQSGFWLAETAYALGDFVRATTYDGRRYICIDVGTTGATEPEWNITPGEETEDGTVTWLCCDLLEVDPWSAEAEVGLGEIRRATSYDYRHYVCIVAGETGATQPEWADTPGTETVDGEVTWLCLAAWHKEAAVTGVTDRRVFEAVSLADTNDAFNYGVLLWLTGANAGYEMEVKEWVLTGHTMTLFEKMPFVVTIGDLFAVTMGCDRRLATCKARFDNIVNMRAEPYLPGTDEVLKYGG
jgi:hypothetical protein